MSIPLKGQTIFIDTSIFVAKKFDTTCMAFGKVKELCQSGKLTLVITNITREEIYSNIKEHAQTVFSALRKFLREGTAIITDSTTHNGNLLTDLTVEKIEKQLKNQVDNFLKECAAKTINLPSNSVSWVFDRYFSKRPPFGAGKKKAEFPDAFVMSALEETIQSKVHGNYVYGIYVISSDGDFLSACNSENKLYGIKSLEEFLNLYNKDQGFSDKIYQYINTEHDCIIQRLQELLEDSDFYLTDNFGGDEIEGNVLIDHIEIKDVYIIDLQEDSTILQLETEVQVSGDGIHYSDPYGFHREDGTPFDFCSLARPKATVVIEYGENPPNTFTFARFWILDSSIGIDYEWTNERIF